MTMLEITGVRFFCISFTTHPLLDESGEPLFPIILKEES